MNRTRDAYDRWSVMYDTDPNPQTLLEERAVVELVSPSQSDRILDAACGTGRYCRIFLERCAEVVGIDFSQGMLRMAQAELSNVEFHCADLTMPLPFDNEIFSKVNCAQALKHLPDIRPVLREFARVVMRGGTITFSITHPDMNWEGYELSFQPSLVLSEESDIHHHRFCDYFEATAMAGLRLVEFRQVLIDETIKEFLTSGSFERVKGRYQIAIFHLEK